MDSKYSNLIFVKKRLLLIVTLTAFLIGSSHAQTTRPRSRLTQMFNNLVDDMGDVASRIGHGFMRTFNGPGTVARERPIVPRQQTQINSPARQQDDNAIAPNDPAVRPPVALRQRPRLSFRQFVDGVMSGITNLVPRLRRRNFNRNNRAGQVSHGQRRIKRRALEIVREIPDSGTKQSGVTVSSAVQVTVNIFDNKQKGASPDDGDHKNQYSISYTETPVHIPDEEIHIMYHPDSDVEVTQGPPEYSPEISDVYVETGSLMDDHMTENDWPPFSSWLHSDGYVFNDDKAEINPHGQFFESVKLPETSPPDNAQTFYQEDELSDSPVPKSPETRISGDRFAIPGFRDFDISSSVNRPRFGIIDHPGYYDDINLGNPDLSHHQSGPNNHWSKPKFDTDNTDVLSSVFLSHMYDAQGNRDSGNKRKHAESYPLGFKEGFMQGFSHGFDKGQTETSFSQETHSTSESNTHNKGTITSLRDDFGTNENRRPDINVNSFYNSNTQPGTHQQSHHSRPVYSTNRPNVYKRRPITNSHSNTYDTLQFNNNQPIINYQSQSNKPVNHNSLSNNPMLHHHNDNQPSFTNIDQAQDNSYHSPNNRPNYEHKGNQNYSQNSSNEQVNPFSNWVQVSQTEGFNQCDGRCMWNQLIQYLDHFSINSESRGT
ncbi:homeobox protein 3-like [Palaemon carinicauda]|uniref:homeobox protein 3-like n=1 Tax=Palaemon carinicauda TaxID=392227 RepID=UPI0035B58843